MRGSSLAFFFSAMPVNRYKQPYLYAAIAFPVHISFSMWMALLFFYTGINNSLGYTAFMMLGIVLFFYPAFLGLAVDRYGTVKMLRISLLLMASGLLMTALPANGDALFMLTCFSAIALSAGYVFFNITYSSVVLDNSLILSGPERDVAPLWLCLSPILASILAYKLVFPLHDMFAFLFGLGEKETCNAVFILTFLLFVISVPFLYRLAGKEGVSAQEIHWEKETAKRRKKSALSRFMFLIAVFFMLFPLNNRLVLDYGEEFILHNSFISFVTLSSFNILLIAAFLYSLLYLVLKKGRRATVAVGIMALSVLLLCLDYSLGFRTYVPLHVHKLTATFMLAFAPFLAVLRTHRLKNTSVPYYHKAIPVGIVLVSVAFAVLFISRFTVDVSGNISALWLLAAYMLFGFSGAIIFTAGIHYVNDNAPLMFQGRVLGLWFLISGSSHFSFQIPVYIFKDCDPAISFALLSFIALLFAYIMHRLLKVGER